MDQAKNVSRLKEIITSIEMKSQVESIQKSEAKIMGHRFDIFKGKANENGKISKIRSVGSAFIKNGHRTYAVTLKTFLNEKYYLLPNSKSEVRSDYIILTREPAHHIPRKYFWNSIGEGAILDGVNQGLMKLAWDLLADDIFMSLHPMQSQVPARMEEDVAA